MIVTLTLSRIYVMSKSHKQTVRKPAIKFPNLRKKMLKQKVEARKFKNKKK